MTPEEILAIRKKICVTQEKFASLIGTTVVSVNRWENGKTKPCRYFIKQLKEIKATSGSYVCRRKKLKES